MYYANLHSDYVLFGISQTSSRFFLELFSLLKFFTNALRNTLLEKSQSDTILFAPSPMPILQNPERKNKMLGPRSCLVPETGLGPGMLSCSPEMPHARKMVLLAKVNAPALDVKLLETACPQHPACPSAQAWETR